MKTSKIREHLKKELRCEVLWDTHTLNFYSVDSSSYRIVPKVVTIPNTLEDVVRIVRFANKNNVSIIARGASTGLVGSALGSGIVIDLKKFNKIKVNAGYAEVGSGVLKGDLDKALEKHKKIFPPNPSVGPFCSIGGMIASNASGSKSLKYGSVIDNILEVVLVDGTGKVIKLPDDKKTAKRIYKLTRSLDYSRFPKVSKNSSGYRFDAIQSISDTHKIIAASEGTLGVIISAKLKIIKKPHQRLAIVAYKSVKEALSSCKEIIKLKPAALEFVDHNIIKNIDYGLSPNSKCLLFVEFDTDMSKNILRLTTKIQNGKIVEVATNKNSISRWWRFRDSALHYSIKTMKKNHNQLPHTIEDAALPVENIYTIYKIVRKINDTYNTKAMIYGHAGNGNLHVRLIARDASHKTVKIITRYYFSEIIKNGGTISGEHGDGLARSEFVRSQYGIANYKVFEKLKKMFDPKSILNPDKIITSKSTITKYL